MKKMSLFLVAALSLTQQAWAEKIKIVATTTDLADIARAQKIDVPANDLRNALMAEARRYPGQEKAVIEYYTKTEGALERLRAPLLEEKVVDYILTQAKVTETKIAAEDLLKKAEEAEEDEA